MDVSDYLDRRYSLDRAMVTEVQLQTDRALETLLKTNLGQDGWPYSLTDGNSLQRDEFSESTAAMILHAVAVEYGVITDSVLVPRTQSGMVRTGDGKKRKPEAVSKLLRDGETVSKLLRDGTTALIKDFPNGDYLTSSKTWGHDSPLTLTWVYELLKANVTDDTQVGPVLARIATLADQWIKVLIDDPASMVLKFTPNGDDYPIPHTFVLLRALQLTQAVRPERLAELQLKKLPSVFLNQLHTELSNSAIQDGGFDPACLVFALEGLLILNRDAITDSLLQQVVDILGKAPAVVTHWQPVRPLVVNKRGFTLLPQSVEVANSYLRICGFEEDKRRISPEPLFTRSFAALQSYADWLLSRVYTVHIDIEANAAELQGWQSEHTYKPDILHLWATSQVVLFLQAYGAMLQQHIAHAAGVAVNLDFRRKQKKSPKEASDAWEKAKQKREPLLGLTGAFQAYNRVDTLVVAPRNDTSGGSPSSSAKYSILLYGPPGTGKTSFCESLAAALQYDFVYVSPSDFIRGGEAGVEDRAKRVFEALLEQSNCVILLDEVDRLLLDRDSVEYARQGDMFQFMTPSMLTKINDLRQKETSVLVIATNYAERIDSAIKRPGRIDEQIALLPPNRERRVEIIIDCAKDVGVTFDSTDIDEIANRTSLYIYKELEYIVQAVANRGSGTSESEAITEILEQFGSPTISLESYNGRFHRADVVETDGDQIDPDSGSDKWVLKDLLSTPWKEFALLAYLQAETDPGNIPDWAEPVLKDISNRPKFFNQLGPIISPWLRSYVDSLS
ncbi:AAA family ATPase [Mycolicibacterium tusciae]|uniref:AAA family ATPase n=1 Tax=Mycolicibacterium tusciae TaxID=75922 RepID=UPI00024A12F0|nr:AAA family ATPase [Mycolicibacterium tusciae]